MESPSKGTAFCLKMAATICWLPMVAAVFFCNRYLRNLAIAAVALLAAGAAHAQVPASSVHGLSTSTTSPVPANSCLFVDQGPGTPTKLCSGYITALGGLTASNNLSDLTNTTSARGNLGLSTVATFANPGTCSLLGSTGSAFGCNSLDPSVTISSGIVASQFPIQPAKTSSYGILYTGSSYTTGTDAFTILPFACTSSSSCVATLPHSTGSIFPPGSSIIITNKNTGATLGDGTIGNVIITATTSTMYGVPITNSGGINYVTLTGNETVKVTADASNNYFFAYMPSPVPGGDFSSSTGYTAATWDCWQTRHLTSGSPVSITIPNNLPPNCKLTFQQDGAGQLALVNGAGFTLHSAHGWFHSFGQYSIIGVSIDPGQTTGVFWGDGAT